MGLGATTPTSSLIRSSNINCDCCCCIQESRKLQWRRRRAARAHCQALTPPRRAKDEDGTQRPLVTHRALVTGLTAMSQEHTTPTLRGQPVTIVTIPAATRSGRGEPRPRPLSSDLLAWREDMGGCMCACAEPRAQRGTGGWSGAPASSQRLRPSRRPSTCLP